MCGIAGVVTHEGRTPPDPDELLRMAAMLQHRGPDGHGIYADDRAGLAHTRLSLVDLRGGAQPLANEDQTLWLVGNGEVFDHESQRRTLEQRGHRFGTHSDMEVLLHAYEQWGDEAWQRLDAQFAVALWDTRAQRLVLARDRFGILPLHYAVLSDAVVFASEQKALFAGGRIAPAFDAEIVRQVFTYWSAPGPRSVFAGVRSVPPATRINFTANGTETRHRWWQPDFRVDADESRSTEEAVSELRARLDRAVQLRLQADVPVGAYISGGLDSSVLVALAVRAGVRPVTFSLGFDDPAFDETAPQRRAAELFGTEHHEVRCSERDIRDRLSDVVWHCETPLLRTAPVPMFMLSELVQQRGIKSVLTGEGADELLAGYSVFQEDKVRRFAARQPESTTRPALFARVHEFVGTSAQRDSAMWRAFLAKGLTDTGDPLYSHRVRWQNGAWATRLLDLPPVTEGTDDAVITALLPRPELLRRALARAQAIELATFMTPYLLCSQGDRVALAHGVEARYPFLAPDVASLCLGLPDGDKLRGLTTKVALRRLAAPLLPASIHRRTKHPYRAPTTTALLSSGANDRIDELLSEHELRRNPLLAADAAIRLVAKLRRAPERASEREGMALCGLCTMQMLRWDFLEHFSAHAARQATALAGRKPQVFVTADAHPQPRGSIR